MSRHLRNFFPFGSQAALHRDDLAIQAARSLQAGQFGEVYRMADRLCRISSNEARFFLVRAHALSRLNEAEASDRDLRTAFALDPRDPVIAKAAVAATGNLNLSIEAAHEIVASSRSDSEGLARAIDVIIGSGTPLVANLRLDGAQIKGWFATSVDGPIEISVGRFSGPDFIVKAAELRVSPNSEGVRLIDVSSPVPADIAPAVTFLSNGIAIDAFHAFAREDFPASQFYLAKDRAGAPALVQRRPRCCAVIVPVFGDIARTADCLRSIARQTTSATKLRVILVNDNPRDAAVAALVESFATQYQFEIISNAHNLGLVESVNRALAATSDEDVILVNADVVLPQRAIDRLIAAAYREPAIGTVVPLSNNGELTSFPRPWRANAMQSLDEIDAIDTIAARVNKGMGRTILNGTGFCLYIKRQCLDAVGPLRTAYLRGYFEDVDFCFRAREAGFRNVCAVDVYVGHLGSRSFANEKRALVSRNQKVLEARFPAFLANSVAFMQADPLRTARARIEAEAAKPKVGARLVIANYEQEPALQARLSQLGQNNVPAYWLAANSAFEPRRLTLRFDGDGLPQASAFDVSKSFERRRLFALLHRLGVVSVEMFSDVRHPALLEDFLAAGVLDIWMLADRSPFSIGIEANAVRCAVSDDTRPCPACVKSRSISWLKPESAIRSKHLSSGAIRIETCNRMAKAVFDRLELSNVNAEPPKRARRKDVAIAKNGVLGILSLSPNARSEQLVRALLCESAAEAPEIVLIGEWLDEPSLFSFPGVFITGPVNTGDLNEVARLYRLGAVFDPDRAGTFREIDGIAAATGVPIAYFDWSFGALAKDPADLALDPRCCDAKSVRLLRAWHERGKRTN